MTITHWIGTRVDNRLWQSLRTLDLYAAVVTVGRLHVSARAYATLVDAFYQTVPARDKCTPSSRTGKAQCVFQTSCLSSC